MSGLGKLVNAGAAHLQHVNLASQALAAPPADVGRQLRAYTQGLSAAGFAGLIVTLSMRVYQERDRSRKAGLQRLLEAADTARCGELPRDVPAPAPPGPAHSFDDDLARVGRWNNQLDGPGRQRALVAHVLQPYFNPHSFGNTLVLLGQTQCRDAEQFKAWSQNMGHDGVLTTFLSYGAVAPRRQGQFIQALGLGNGQPTGQAGVVAQAVLQAMRGAGSLS